LFFVNIQENNLISQLLATYLGTMAEDGVPDGAGETNGTSSKYNTPHSNKSGWDGKLRVNKQATLVNPEALSDPEYSDEDAPPVDQIAADEGMSCQSPSAEHRANYTQICSKMKTRTWRHVRRSISICACQLTDRK